MKGWAGKTRGRLIALFWLFAFLYMLLVGRLAHLQYFKSHRYAAMAREQQETVVQIPAVRGDIRDRNNVILARSLSLNSIAVNPKEVKDKDAAAAALAKVLPIPEKEIRATLAIPCSFQWLARKVPDQVATAVTDLKIAGVFLNREATPGKRFYPKGRLASHLIGATGTDDQGLDGLEASYDKYLGGESGLFESFVDRDGWIIPGAGQAQKKSSVPGRHLVLTIDEGIQYVAEREVAKAVKERHAKGGVCIVMDIRTGEILAMAVCPDFPTKDFGKVPAALRRNRAITDAYEPGSTFKVFLAAAAVNSGIGKDEMFLSGGVLNFGEWTIHNSHDGAGSANLREIIAQSYNVGTASVALRIGKKALSKHLEAFGFGRQTGIDLMGEGEGILAPVKDWAALNTATISFGQGVSVTPIQMVSALQAVGNKGVRMKPHVVKALLNPDGTVYKEFKPKVIGKPVTESTAKEVVSILRNVCVNGTGKLATIPGYHVGGKTGTAQVVRGGGYAAGAYISSFLGLLPEEEPRIAILIKIEEPTPVYYGGVVAGPVFAEVAKEAMWRLGVAPTHPEEITAQNHDGEKNVKR